jgi:hypothetical protein
MGGLQEDGKHEHRPRLGHHHGGGGDEPAAETGRRERLSTDTEASEGGVMTTETTETMAAERERQARRMRRI